MMRKIKFIFVILLFFCVTYTTDFDVPVADAASKSSIEIIAPTQNPKMNLDYSAVGKTYTLKYKVKGGSKLAKVSYSTSSKKIATVSGKGKIKIKSSGCVSIIVHAVFKNGQTSSDMLIINISMPVKSVKLSTGSANKYGKYTLVPVGKKIKLTARTYPSVSYKNPVKFSSSNKKIATVDSKGVVRGKKVGKTTITAYVGYNKKIKKSVKVWVVKPVTSISVNNGKTSVSITKGKTSTLKVAVNNSATIKKVKYTSSDQSVATVSSSGKITAKGAGSCTITVSAVDGFQARTSVRVRVKNPSASASPDTTSDTTATSAKTTASTKAATSTTKASNTTTAAKTTTTVKATATEEPATEAHVHNYVEVKDYFDTVIEHRYICDCGAEDGTKYWIETVETSEEACTHPNPVTTKSDMGTYYFYTVNCPDCFQRVDSWTEEKDVPANPNLCQHEYVSVGTRVDEIKIIGLVCTSCKFYDYMDGVHPFKDHQGYNGCTFSEGMPGRIPIAKRTVDIVRCKYCNKEKDGDIIKTEFYESAYLMARYVTAPSPLYNLDMSSWSDAQVYDWMVEHYLCDLTLNDIYVGEIVYK